MQQHGLYREQYQHLETSKAYTAASMDVLDVQWCVPLADGDLHNLIGLLDEVYGWMSLGDRPPDSIRWHLLDLFETAKVHDWRSLIDGRLAV